MSIFSGVLVIVDIALFLIKSKKIEEIPLWPPPGAKISHTQLT